MSRGWGYTLWLAGPYLCDLLLALGVPAPDPGTRIPVPVTHLGSVPGNTGGSWGCEKRKGRWLVKGSLTSRFLVGLTTADSTGASGIQFLNALSLLTAEELLCRHQFPKSLVEG